jgi:hypothetical protein
LDRLPGHWEKQPSRLTGLPADFVAANYAIIADISNIVLCLHQIRPSRAARLIPNGPFIQIRPDVVFIAPQYLGDACDISLRNLTTISHSRYRRTGNAQAFGKMLLFPAKRLDSPVNVFNAHTTNNGDFRLIRQAKILTHRHYLPLT